MGQLFVDTWESQGDIDEAVLSANGVYGIFMRLNDMNGGHHLDTYFATQWEQAKNMLRVPYFVYNPWVNGQTNFDWLRANMPQEAKAIAIDIEVVYTGYSSNTYAQEVSKFYALCKQKWNTIIYTGEWFLSYLSYWPADADYWWAQYPLAFYPSTTQTWTWNQIRDTLVQYPRPMNESRCPGRVLMWQFTGDRLILPGSTRKIDVNVAFLSSQDFVDWCGGYAVPQNDPPVLTHPYDGADYIRKRAYNSDCHIFTIHKGTTQVYQSISSIGKATVLAMALKTGADIAVNGGDYNVYTGDPTGLLAVNGVIKSPKEGYMPWLNASQDNIITIEEWNSTTKPYNAVALRRMLVRDGKISTDTSPAWYERHPKTAYGVNAQGELIIVEVDGRTSISAGVTLFELAQLMIDAGAVRAGDGGGGGDCTVVVNGVVTNVPIANTTPGELRLVADAVIVFEPEGGTGMTLGTAQEKLNKTVTVRSKPTINSLDTGLRIQPYGITNWFKIVDDVDHPGDPNYKWFQIDEAGTKFCAYFYPNSLSATVQRFTIKSYPTDGTTVPFTMTISIQGFKPLTISGNLEKV